MDGTIILQYAKEIYFPSALLDGYFCAVSRRCSFGAYALIALHFVRGRYVLADRQPWLRLLLSLQCLTACTEQYPN